MTAVDALVQVVRCHSDMIQDLSCRGALDERDAHARHTNADTRHPDSGKAQIHTDTGDTETDKTCRDNTDLEHADLEKISSCASSPTPPPAPSSSRPVLCDTPPMPSILTMMQVHLASGGGGGRGGGGGGGAYETAVPSMLKMLQAQLVSERMRNTGGGAYDDSPVEHGPPRALMELIQQSPVNLTVEERLRAFSSLVHTLQPTAQSTGGAGERGGDGGAAGQVLSLLALVVKNYNYTRETEAQVATELSKKKRMGHHTASAPNPVPLRNLLPRRTCRSFTLRRVRNTKRLLLCLCV